MSDIQEPEDKKPTKKEPKFNFNVKNKKAFANSENIKQGLDYLESKVKDELEGLKNVKGRSKEKDNYYVSLYLLNQSLGHAEKGPIYKRAIPIYNDIKRITRKNPFGESGFKIVVNNFNRKWDEVHNEIPQKNDAIENAASNAANELKQSVTAPKAEPVPHQATEPEGSQSAAVSQTVGAPQDASNAGPAQQPQPAAPVQEPQPQAQPATPVAPTTEAPKVEQPLPPDLENKTPQEIVNEIKKMRENTKGELETLLAKLEKSKDVTANMQTGLVTNTLRRYLGKMDKFIKNAGAGPYNAKQAYVKADSASTIAKHTAQKHTLHRAARRTIERARETGQALGARAKESSKRFKNWTEKSETLAKVRSNVKPAMERAKQGMEAGVEKVMAGTEARNAQNFELISSMLGKAALEEFKKANSIKRAMMLRKARAKRNGAMNPAQQPIVTPAPQQPKQLTATPPQLPAPRNEDVEFTRKIVTKYIKKQRKGMVV